MISDNNQVQAHPPKCNPLLDTIGISLFLILPIVQMGHAFAVVYLENTSMILQFQQQYKVWDDDSIQINSQLTILVFFIVMASLHFIILIYLTVARCIQPRRTNKISFWAYMGFTFMLLSGVLFKVGYDNDNFLVQYLGILFTAFGVGANGIERMADNQKIFKKQQREIDNNYNNDNNSSKKKVQPQTSPKQQKVAERSSQIIQNASQLSFSIPEDDNNSNHINLWRQ